MADRILYTKETLQYLLHPDMNPGSLLERQVESMTHMNVHLELSFRIWNLPASSEYSAVCPYSRRTAELKKVGLHFHYCCIALRYGLYCTEMVCSALPPRGLWSWFSPPLAPPHWQDLIGCGLAPPLTLSLKFPCHLLSLSSLGIVQEKIAWTVFREKGAFYLFQRDWREREKPTHYCLHFPSQEFCKL